MVPNAPVEQTGTVTGRVINVYTGYGLYNARVSINGTSLYTYSDRNGYFTLDNVPAGDQTLTISLYGYRTVSGNIPVNVGRTTNVTVRLTPNSYYYKLDDETEDKPITDTPIIDIPIIELPVIENPVEAK